MAQVKSHRRDDHHEPCGGAGGNRGQRGRLGAGPMHRCRTHGPRNRRLPAIARALRRIGAPNLRAAGGVTPAHMRRYRPTRSPHIRRRGISRPPARRSRPSCRHAALADNRPTLGRAETVRTLRRRPISAGSRSARTRRCRRMAGRRAPSGTHVAMSICPVSRRALPHAGAAGRRLPGTRGLRACSKVHAGTGKRPGHLGRRKPRPHRAIGLFERLGPRDPGPRRLRRAGGVGGAVRLLRGNAAVGVRPPPQSVPVAFGPRGGPTPRRLASKGPIRRSGVHRSPPAPPGVRRAPPRLMGADRRAVFLKLGVATRTGEPNLFRTRRVDARRRRGRRLPRGVPRPLRHLPRRLP